MNSERKVLDTFRERFAYDRGLSRVRPVEHYQRMFAGFDAAIASEYARLEAEAATPRAVAPPAAAAPEPPQPRDPLTVGSYRLVREIGRGGQATVHLAEDTRLRRRVALKVFAPGLLPSEQFLARFRREAEAASRLDHPGICAVYEAGVDRETPYIAMRYVEGQTLAQRIDAAAAARGSGATSSGLDLSTMSATGGTERSSPVMRIVALGEKLARALHAAHEAGLVHRDVKPGNVIVTDGGEPVLLDFGLAREDDHGQTLTVTGALLGTPAYMSPEQLLAQRIRLDCRTDVYSLGVTLYECLTLRRPFDAPTREALYQQILASEAEAPRRANPQISRDLEVVLETAMEKNRDRRYRTALDFAEDLRRVREHEPIRARPTPPLVRLGRWAQRHPAVATAAVAVFTGLVLGLTTVTHFLGQSREEQRRTEDALSEARDATARATSESAAKTKALEEREAALRRAKSLALAAMSSSVQEADPMQALLLAREAVTVEPSVLAVNQLRAALFESRARALIRPPGHGVSKVNVSPRGDLIVTTRGTDAAHVWDVSGRQVAALRGHQGIVVAAEFSSDGERIVTASRDGTARVFHVSGRELAVLRGHSGAVESAGFSAKGDRILTHGKDGTARLWDDAGRELLTVKGGDLPISYAALSPKGDRILTSSRLAVSDRPSTLWDDAGREIARLPGWSLGFSPSGDRVMTVADAETARVFDLSGKELFTLNPPGSRYYDTAFSPSGDRLVTSTTDGPVRILDASGKEISVLAGFTGSAGLKYSANGDRVVGAGSTSVCVWDASGRQLAGITGTWLRPAGFVSAGNRVVTSEFDGTVGIWDVLQCEAAVLEGHQGRLVTASFSPQGDRILTASEDATARVWDVAGTELAALKGHEGALWSALFSPAGDRIATASEDRTARIWDPAGRQLSVLKGHESPVHYAVFSAQGDRVVTSSGEAYEPGDNTARIWDLAGREIAVLRGHESLVYRPSFSPQGDCVLTSSYDCTVRLWDLAGKELLQFPRAAEAVYRAAFSPDGERIAATDWRCTRVWSRSGAELLNLEHGGFASWTGFSPGGDRVLSKLSDMTVRVWDLEGKPRAELRGHTADIRSVTMSAQGDRIATASDDGTARLWSEDGREVAILRGHEGPVRTVAFSPDGSKVVTASDDSTARVWLVRTDDLLKLARERIVRRWTRIELAKYADLLGPENAVALAAHRVVDRHGEASANAAETLERVKSDPSLDDALRAAALQIAAEREDDPSALNEVAWPVVESAGRSEDEVRLALRRLETAVRLAPDDYAIVNSLAVAQYRAGRYADAIATLTRAAELYAKFDDGANPSDLAFLAMSRHRLGDTAEARRVLAQLRAVVKGRARLDDSDTGAVKEAEALVGGD